MGSKWIRASLVLMGSTVLAGVASADDQPQARYLRFGQGSFMVVAPAPQQAPPHALTGRADTRDARYWTNQNVRVIDVGQGRVIVR